MAKVSEQSSSHSTRRNTVARVHGRIKARKEERIVSEVEKCRMEENFNEEENNRAREQDRQGISATRE